MEGRYTQEFYEMIEDDRLQYETFKDNIRTVPDAFQEAVTSEMTIDQLTEIVNSLDSVDYQGTSEVRITADTYSRLGIIETDTRTFSGTTVYRAPNYNGRGSSKSWDDIVTELEHAALQAEKEKMRDERRNRQRTMEEFR